MTRHFIVGDVHGHHNRFRKLLMRAGLLDKGEKRIGDRTVVQVGDLVNLSLDTRPQDEETLRRCVPWIDVFLMGNHEAAAFDKRHRFWSFAEPTAAMLDIMVGDMNHAVAYAAGEYLITHAGLAPGFTLTSGITNPKVLAAKLNAANADDPAVCNIGRARGGADMVGGVLWRDDSEALAPSVKQVFGHTCDKEVREYDGSYCIDICGITNGRLAGIFLPECKVISI